MRMLLPLIYDKPSTISLGVSYLLLQSSYVINHHETSGDKISVHSSCICDGQLGGCAEVDSALLNVRRVTWPAAKVTGR